MAALGDGAAVGADPPQVDEVAQDVEPGRGDEGPGQGRLVLVAQALGEREARVLPELASVDLVDGEDVGQHQRHVGEREPLAVRCVVELHQPGQALPPVLVALQPADHHVGAGPRDGGHHRLVGPGHQQVVGVEEGEVGAARLRDPPVAGGAQAGVGLVDDPEPRVLGGVPLGDGDGAVGAAVVDQDRLEPGVGLGQQALEGVGDVALDVVNGDDDTQEQGMTPAPEQTDLGSAPSHDRHPTPTGPGDRHRRVLIRTPEHPVATTRRTPGRRGPLR